MENVMEERITKTFAITTSPDVMERFERFLALLHYNSCFGHSGLFAMPLDGDGSDKVEVSPRLRFQHEVDLCAGIGGDVEIAYDDCYTVKRVSDMGSNWVVKTGGILYKDYEQVKAVPSSQRG